MKLDKIKFARLIGIIEHEIEKLGYLTLDAIGRIDNLIDVEVPEAPVHATYPSTGDINRLMYMMATGNANDSPTGASSKIEAIKLYRKLTGWGLKESKDQVEKYWPKLSNHFLPITEETLHQVDKAMSYTPPSQDFGDRVSSTLDKINAGII